MVMHGLVESGLVVDGSLCVIFVIFRKFLHLCDALLVVLLYMLFLLIEANLNQLFFQVTILTFIKAILPKVILSMHFYDWKW